MLPTVAGFLLFIRNVMGISPLVLPDNSPTINWALSIATMFVNPDLGVVGKQYREGRSIPPAWTQ